MKSHQTDIPRVEYGIQLGIGCLVAAAAVVWAVLWADGGMSEGRAALIALAIGALPTLIPVFAKIRKEQWGVAVLAAGACRALLSMGGAYIITQQATAMQARPVFMGLAIGLLILMIAETALSIRILSSLERARAPMQAALPHQA